MPHRPSPRSARPDADAAPGSPRTRAGLAAGAAVAVAAGLLGVPVAAAADDTPTPAPGTSTPAPGTTTPAPGATTPAPTATPTPTPTPTKVRLPKPRTWVTARLTWPYGVPGSPSDGTRVGVGILPVLRFSQDIPRKAVVEEAITVSSPKGKLPRGSWAWIDDRTAVYRTKRFWPGKARIDIKVDLENQVLGKSGERFLIGAESLGTTYSFKTARSFIAYVNASTAQMKVTIDGKVTKQFGVSLGKSGWESRSGIKVYYGSKEATHTYTNDSLGVEEEYTLVAPWNVRLTPTGEFIHTARWAYSRIGRYNGSHGCTNMFEADAKWIYDRVLPGDVFKYTGTSKPMESTNGPLALWNIPWADWQTRSALS